MCRYIGTVTTPLETPIPNPRRWLAMPFIALGVAMIIVDATIVNVAVPSIIRSLHLSATSAEWLNSIYSLVFAALLISAGRAGDRWGRRRLFLLGTVVFVGASLVAALAPSGEILILGRFLQGIGGAMILPSTLSTVNALFVGRERAIAFAIWGSTIGGVAAIGPLVGGWLTTDVSWRWAFLVNVPVGLIIVLGVTLFIPETSQPDSARGSDFGGNVLVTLGFSGVVFALIEGTHYGWWYRESPLTLGGVHWTSGVSPVPVAAAIGVLSLAIFWRHERSRARSGAPVLVDPALFAIRSFAAGNVAALVVSLGEFGVLFVLPLFLQGVRGFSALGTGVLLLALAGGSLVAGGLTPQLAQRVSARTVARTGLALEFVGLVVLGLVISPSVSGLDLVPALLVYGLGVGLATAQLTGVILADVPVQASGSASGVQSTTRQVGSALGIAILGTVYVSEIGRRTLSGTLAVSGTTRALATSLSSAVRQSGGSVVSTLAPGPLRAAAAAAVASATRLDAFVAATFIVVGLAATFRLPREPGDRP